VAEPAAPGVVLADYSVCAQRPHVCVRELAEIAKSLLKYIPFLVDGSDGCGSAPALVLNPLVLTCGDSSGCGATVVRASAQPETLNEAEEEAIRKKESGELYDK
jgi:hypothetical protein